MGRLPPGAVVMAVDWLHLSAQGIGMGIGVLIRDAIYDWRDRRKAEKLRRAAGPRLTLVRGGQDSTSGGLDRSTGAGRRDHLNQPLQPLP